MKSNLFFKILPILIMAIIFAGCSKENPVTSNDNGSIVKNVSPGAVTNPAKLSPISFGSISGVLYPIPAKAVIRAVNDHYVSEEAVGNPDGSFAIQNLPPDGYYLLISYVPVNYPDYLTFKVYKIAVESGQETIVGQINLPG